MFVWKILFWILVAFIVYIATAGFLYFFLGTKKYETFAQTLKSGLKPLASIFVFWLVGLCFYFIVFGLYHLFFG